MSTVADKLRAEGVPLELGDKWVAVKFTNRGLAEIEKRFGSCLAFEAKLNQALTQHIAGPIITVCLDGLAAALCGPRSRWTEEAIDAAMDPKQLPQYLDVLIKAWDQAWPESEEKSDQGNADGTPVNSSTGSPTSSSPSSDSVAPSTSSGS